MSQPKGSLYTFGFAAAICVICSLILSVASTSLKPLQVQNARLDILKNLLNSVGYSPNELKAKSAGDIIQIYRDEFEILLLDKDNNKAERSFMEAELLRLGYQQNELAALDTDDLLGRFTAKKGILAKRNKQKLMDYDPSYKILYVHKTKGQPDAYVVPIEGFGLWDLIKGYIALDLDLNTVKGISFYWHKETPGLGARITEDWFKKNFEKKRILDEHGELVAVAVAKGSAQGNPHKVDGISGATLTCQGLTTFLKTDLERYEPYFKTLRQN